MVGGQRHAPVALPPGKTRYPLYRRLGGPQGQSGQVRNTSPLAGFDPRTVQPLASCYNDYAPPAHNIKYISKWGYAVEQLVEALRYKPVDRGFDSRWCHWNF